MAEQVGRYILHPNANAFKERLRDAFKDAVERTAEQAYNTVMMAWDSEEGYTESGDLVDWEVTKQANPILDDTGNLKRNLEIVIQADGMGFSLEVNDDDTSAYPQPEEPGLYGGQGLPRHAANISMWNSSRPHTGIPKEYASGGSDLARIIDEEFDIALEIMMSDGTIEIMGRYTR